MYFVGIDISKFKHDCFITTESGEFVINSFSIKNDNDGFQELLSVLESLNSNLSNISVESFIKVTPF